MAYIYKHIRKDTNEIFYIGIGKNIERMNSKYSRNTHWHSIVKKYDYYSEIIEDKLTWEEACNLEKYWIKHYGRSDLNEGNLVNKTDGGEGIVGRIITDEHKEKLRHAAKNRVFSEEHKENLRLAQIGRKYTDADKKKMSEIAKGKSKSDEHKKNIGESSKGIERSESFKENLRNIYKNRKRNKDMTWKE